MSGSTSPVSTRISQRSSACAPVPATTSRHALAAGSSSVTWIVSASTFSTLSIGPASAPSTPPSMGVGAGVASGTVVVGRGTGVGSGAWAIGVNEGTTAAGAATQPASAISAREPARRTGATLADM